MKNLPDHLKKYIVDQDESKYSPVDQACWRYILRQLKRFLALHAHESYLAGLAKTGITTERIPSIKEISKHLEAFGWRALPVSGFIPPAAFMELQSLGVLPIASDMRSLEHLSYTPAPDIVHEAAGHAPILIHPEFAAYLKKYAEVAKKAILSSEDLSLYSAIRELSDLKENPDSTSVEIGEAQSKLDQISKSMSHVSEAGELSRMNWWTAEYGLIGDLNAPKIYGAGLLSSVGESRWCLSAKVKKIPLSIGCIHQSYDITEPQPQLFVARDFQHLGSVLDEMTAQMAFKTGGLTGLQKAIRAKTMNTYELNSGLQISGQITEALSDSQGQVIYVQNTGPTQISFGNQQLENQGPEYHHSGYGTAIGLLKSSQRCLSEQTELELEKLGLSVGKDVRLEFASGVIVNGKVQHVLKRNQRNLMISFEPCEVRLGSKVLFDPTWGTYDLALGHKVSGVYSGAADLTRFPDSDSFEVKRVSRSKPTSSELQLWSLYQQIRDHREASPPAKKSPESLVNTTLAQLEHLQRTEWLLILELYELSLSENADRNIKTRLESMLNQIKLSHPELGPAIQDGIDAASEKSL